jgi:hypothetical protein
MDKSNYLLVNSACLPDPVYKQGDRQHLPIAFKSRSGVREQTRCICTMSLPPCFTLSIEGILKQGVSRWNLPLLCAVKFVLPCYCMPTVPSFQTLCSFVKCQHSTARKPRFRTSGLSHGSVVKFIVNHAQFLLTLFYSKL